MTDLKAIKERALELLALDGKRQQGDWQHDGQTVFIDERYQVCCGRGGLECCGCPDVAGDLVQVANADGDNVPFIASAPSMAQTIRELLAVVERLEADAGRYAFLRCHVPSDPMPKWMEEDPTSPEHLDRILDAAMSTNQSEVKP